jgi:hypothetical protein
MFTPSKGTGFLAFLFHASPWHKLEYQREAAAILILIYPPLGHTPGKTRTPKFVGTLFSEYNL